MKEIQVTIKSKNDVYRCWFQDEETFDKFLFKVMKESKRMEKNPVNYPTKTAEKGKKQSGKAVKYAPSRKLRKFIENQPNYRFTIQMISKRFYGRAVSSDPANKEDRKIYDNIWKKTNNIKKKLEEKHNGKFIIVGKKKVGKIVTFKFVKNK